jgi:hypothetical protein
VVRWRSGYATGLRQRVEHAQRVDAETASGAEVYTKSARRGFAREGMGNENTCKFLAAAIFVMCGTLWSAPVPDAWACVASHIIERFPRRRAGSARYG